MGTLTATVRANKPAVGGDPAPIWPNELVLSFDLFDKAINQQLSLTLADANVTLIADGSSSDQATYHGLNVSGTQSTSRTITLPACQKQGRVRNGTTGGFALILSTGLGLGFSVPADGNWYGYQCDGVNVISTAVTSVVGQYISATTSIGAAITLTTGIPVNVTAISLPAGDWDVSGTVAFTASGLILNQVNGWVSTTSSSLPQPPNNGAQVQLTPSSLFGTGQVFPVGTLRVSAAGTVYLGAQASFSSGSATAYGFIQARRFA